MATEEDKRKVLDQAAEQLAVILLAQIEEKIIRVKKRHGKTKTNRGDENRAGATL